MRDDPQAIASWIAGLMRENSEALGIIPEPTVAQRYVGRGQYVLQCDERGRRVGYLLHGPPHAGQVLRIAQHCIVADRRLRGYGEAALHLLVERAEQCAVPAIAARCAAELDALGFWLGQGFSVRQVVPGGRRRGRLIVCLVRLLALPLLREGAESLDAWACVGGKELR